MLLDNLAEALHKSSSQTEQCSVVPPKMLHALKFADSEVQSPWKEIIDKPIYNVLSQILTIHLVETSPLQIKAKLTA